MTRIYRYLLAYSTGTLRMGTLHTRTMQPQVMRPQVWSCFALLLVLLIPAAMEPADEEGLRNIGHWLDLPAQSLPENGTQADALVILGGDTRQRLMPAIALFQQGLAAEFWHTGGTVPSYVIVTQAVEMGIPPELITHLSSNSTWEDAQQIALAATERNLDSVLVVTSWYHGRRTLCALRHHLEGSDIQVYYQPVGYDEYGPDNWWHTEIGQKVVLSELTKFGYYWINHGLRLSDC